MKDDHDHMILTHRGSGSGGYLDYVFRSAARELFNVQINDEPLEFKVIKYAVSLYHVENLLTDVSRRNQDFRETVLTVDAQVRLRFAYAYGFRNIQNIVQQLKRNKCDYDFVEIMACPSGCINGGGQIRSSSSNTVQLDDVRQIYENLPRLDQPLNVRNVEEHGIPLFTEYRAIEKNLQNAFHLKW